MDRVNHAKIVKTYLQDLVRRWDEFNSSVNSDYLQHSLILDDTHQRYLLGRYGWMDGKYTYAIAIHIDIIDDRVWIQRNSTEEEIVDTLADHGIPSHEVVLGFISPDLRKLYAYGLGS